MQFMNVAKSEGGRGLEKMKPGSQVDALGYPILALWGMEIRT